MSTTLLARVTGAGSDVGRDVVRSLGIDGRVTGPDDVVVWVGEVTASPHVPLAAAVLRLDDAGRAELRAAVVAVGPVDDPERVLEQRLARAVVATATAGGCTTIVTLVDPAGTELLEQARCVRIGARTWAIDP